MKLSKIFFKAAELCADERNKDYLAWDGLEEASGRSVYRNRQARNKLFDIYPDWFNCVDQNDIVIALLLAANIAESEGL